jgi:AcrR family transcriptional regulator
MNSITRRRSEEADRRRNDILDAAEAIAAELTIDALTMREVARRCRLSRGLIYLYVNGKQELLLALCERAYARLRDRLERAAIHAHSGIDQICGMARLYEVFARESPVRFKAIGRFEAFRLEQKGPKDAVAPIVGRLAIHRLLVGAIERGQHDGSIGTNLPSANVTAMILWKLMHGILQGALSQGPLPAKVGISPRALMDQSVVLLQRWLAPRKEHAQGS